VETLVFSTAAVQWLTFANGCALEALALGGLVLHELSTERVVHSIEVVASAAKPYESPSHVGEPKDGIRQPVGSL
jgi:hypothetical protein